MRGLIWKTILELFEKRSSEGKLEMGSGIGCGCVARLDGVDVGMCQMMDDFQVFGMEGLDWRLGRLVTLKG